MKKDRTRYGFNAMLPIHIVVKNGDIQLFGAVSIELDNNIAGTQASSVSGGRSVSNQLRVDADLKRNSMADES
jgi:hypothetical protein